VVCWIKRAKKMGLNILLDDRFEKDLMKELNIKNHEELEKHIGFLHDETFEAIIESLLNRRKKESKRQKQKLNDIYM
jgi:hypothetical protein